MKTYALLIIFFIFFVNISLSQEKKVLFIIVDGIPADVVEKVATPNLDTISQSGKYMHAYVGGDKGTYSETPTISAVGYNSVLTGTWANKHNVWGNSIKAPNYKYWNIFRVLKTLQPDKKAAIFSSWRDNRIKLIGEGFSEAGNIHLDYSFDGYELDTINFPHDKERNFMHKIDEKVTTEAVSCIREKSPDLSWIYLEYTDDIGHMYGDSKEFYSAVEKMDSQIGRIWKAIQYRQNKFQEDWLIIITTDHGRDEETGRGHGGQSPRQRGGWILMNYPKVNLYAQYYTPSIVDIFPTIARFMELEVPGEIMREIDGIPLIGPVSLIAPVIIHIQDDLYIKWKALARKGTIKIWISDIDSFKEGIAEDYKLMAEVPLENEHVFINIKDRKSSFFKVLLEGPYNTVNKWIYLQDQKADIK